MDGGGGRSSNTYISFLFAALMTSSVLIAWSVLFLSFAIISGPTVFLCLVNSVSFLRLLGGVSCGDGVTDIIWLAQTTQPTSYMLWMSVVRGMRGVGGVCEIVWLGVAWVERG